MEFTSFCIAFALTAIAGLSTGIGGLLILAFDKENYKNLAFFLSLAAGVMICVSFVQIFPESVNNFKSHYGPKIGLQFAMLIFFLGMLFCAIIDKIIPENNFSLLKNTKDINSLKLYRAGIISTIAIILHNFPEGVATFMSAMDSPKLAIPITFAIAMHNIPEGITVASPIYYATGSKRKAVVFSFVSGLSEPFGAVCAYAILEKFMSQKLFGIVFGLVSGIMIYISFRNLLPLAYKYDKSDKTVLYGLILGIAIMLTSLVMFA
ncbi:zinc transporter ZupT [Sedimentibacter sp. zth1]|uniref:zinc transporter ZupT n=1 Tax=Sedimentibacter sp. zth1 TaxID=2816908 RepID=UPI001A91F5EF|nr:zinc transporter ZupT [Sedimentibacter sp. zth1]QSX06058.1 zinc transporter ZupT [Sedimentibacter sp. zth1]